MEKLNVPKLRFLNFRECWQQVKLKDAFSIFNGFAFSSTDSSNTGVRWIKIADVGIQVVKNDNISFLPMDFLYKYPKFILQEGDYIIALTRPILSGKLKLAKIGIEANNCLLNQRVGKIISNNNTDYIYQLLQRQSLINAIENSIAGTDPPNLAPTEINNLKTFLPSLPEQQKIASFLTAVDDKIQLLNKKKELLTKYKKGVMQKLFNQEIRFKDDEGNDYPDWEEKSLGEVLEFEQPSKYLVSSTEYNNKYLTPVVTAGKTFILGYTDEDFGIYTDLPVIIFDDFTTSTQFVDFPFKAKSSAMKILKGRGFNDIKFIYEAMQNIDYEIGGHGRHWISIFSKLNILMPQLPEQTKIANFLSSLDDKIKSINQQITHSQAYKKGLLQQMFV